MDVTVTKSIDLPAPVARVWSVQVDPSVQPTGSRLRQASHPRFEAVGSTMTVFGWANGREDGIVTYSAAPNRHVAVWGATQLGWLGGWFMGPDATVDIQLEATMDGTRVTARTTGRVRLRRSFLTLGALVMALVGLSLLGGAPDSSWAGFAVNVFAFLLLIWVPVGLWLPLCAIWMGNGSALRRIRKGLAAGVGADAGTNGSAKRPA